MIQRIQTLYLFLAALALAALSYFPLASFIGDKDSLVLYAYKLISLVPDKIPGVTSFFMLPILGITGLVLVFTIVTIFLYKKRNIQLNILRISGLLLLVLIGLFFFYYVDVLEDISGGLTEYEIGAYLPVTAFLFIFLAVRGIISDVKFLRSADRLR